jgi:phosphonoacetate hydrolase
MDRPTPRSVGVNGREYPFPRVPAVVICLDGCEPAYLDAAIAAGLMPALEAVKARGTVRTAHSVIPRRTRK